MIVDIVGAVERRLPGAPIEVGNARDVPRDFRRGWIFCVWAFVHQQAELSSKPFAEVFIRRSSSKSVVDSSLVCSCGSQPLPSDLCCVGTISMRPSVGSLLPVVVHIHLML